jgi:multicomponent Na+:H+ antiporter subunit D
MSLLVWPLAVPFATAVAAFLLRARPRARRAVSLGGAVLLFVAALALFAAVWRGGPVAAQMGGWAAPFGITLVADLLAASMTLVTGAAGLALVLYGLGEVGEGEEAAGHAALVHALLGAVCGAYLTGDLFNLYVWFEVMLISAFGLLVLKGGPAQIDAAVKYAALNLPATVAFLAGVGLLYGATGELNMAALRGAVEGRYAETAILAPAALLLFAFALKAGLFPLFFWLPASYHTPSVTVSALFSALLTKVAVYALFRVYTLIFPVDRMPLLQDLLIWVACLTMLVGVLGAAAQNSVLRILSFHIVSQIGYMAFGLALFTPLAAAGGLFYMVHNIVAKTNLFLTGGLASRLLGSEDLSRMGGIYAARPFLAVLFLVSALAMAGMPPFSGFWAKFFLVRESLARGHVVESALALGVGLLTLYSMTKIWTEAFWKPAPEGADLSAPLPGVMLAPAIVFAALVLVGGLWIAPVYAVAERAAGQLFDPSAYLAAVLGAGG